MNVKHPMQETLTDPAFLAAFDLLSDPILICNTGCLTYANPAARHFFQIADEQVGLAYSKVFEKWPVLVRLLAAGEDQANHLEMSFEDGFTFDVQTVPNQEGLLVCMHDVSRLKQRNLLGTDFIHTISHDLRSPLTAILGYVELIDRVGELNDIQRDFMQRVIGSVQHINTLVNDLLVLATCESSDGVKQEMVQLNAIVHTVSSAHYKEMLERELNLEIDIDDDIEIPGDPGQIRILLEKLMENAISYTTKGGSIHIRCHPLGSRVLLQMQDSGIGIPEDEQDMIFMRFYRGRNVSTRILGTGLGLTIVQTIAQNHGGEVEVHSNPGKGSTFSIYFPRL